MKINYIYKTFNTHINIIAMKEKAIVKKTGEILDIDLHYAIKNLTVTLELPDEIKLELEKNISYEYKDINTKGHKEGDHYVLSNGGEYTGDDLIVGVDNIRDYKITNQIKING